MILRRVIKHVRGQEWTAIVIDFFIVVVGVFVGLQVSNWSAERAERVDERQYLVRLHSEMLELAKTNQTLSEDGQDSSDRISFAAEQIVDSSEALNLNARHCRAIWRSHIFADQIYLPSTIEELISSGRLNLISKDEVRSAIVDFAQSVDGYRALVEDVRSDRLVLARKYPLLITPNSTDRDNVRCDFEGMRSSPSFRNDLTDNMYRYKAYITFVIVEQQSKRKELHSLLDTVLGIKHEEEVTP